LRKPVWIVLLAICVAVPVFLLVRRSPTATQAGDAARQVHEATTDRQPVTLDGEILDIACYLDNDLHGPEHRSCASACLKDGQPIGFLDDQGRVFLLIEDHMEKEAYRALKNLAAQRVRIQGDEIHRGGVQSIIVLAVGKASSNGDPASPAGVR
jgi:hypothetical protein